MASPLELRRSNGMRVLLQVGLFAALAAGIVVWRGCGATTEDPRLVEIRSLQDEMSQRFPPGEAIRQPREAADRIAAMERILDKVEALPPELRGKAMVMGAGGMRQMIDAKIEQYFSLPSDQRNTFLDVEIREMEMMRTAFESAEAKRSSSLGGSSKPPPVPFGRPSMSESEANAMRKRLIDATTPEQRSRAEEFFGAIDKRRRERGLPGLPPPP